MCSSRPTEVDATAFVSPDASLGAGVRIGPYAWIGPGVVLGEGSVIEQNAVVGYGATAATRPTVLGPRCRLANNTTVYHSVTLGADVCIRHNAVVREDVIVGAGSSLGSGGGIEPHTRIGAGCSFHSRVHVTDYSRIGDYVFIGPGFVSLSDLYLDYRRPQLQRDYAGVTIGRGARIGGGVLAFPGCSIGDETVVGAGSQVSGQLLARTVYLGVPARAVRRVKPGEALPPVA
jgi:UDP-3-O-[3-hydroxymyristoyl] glucosamine N-acyltransferase